MLKYNTWCSLCKKNNHQHFKISWVPVTPTDEDRGGKCKSQNHFDVLRECSTNQSRSRGQNTYKYDGKEAFQQHPKALPFCIHLLYYKCHAQIKIGKCLYGKIQCVYGFFVTHFPAMRILVVPMSHTTSFTIEVCIYRWQFFNKTNKCTWGAEMYFEQMWWVYMFTFHQFWYAYD